MDVRILKIKNSIMKKHSLILSLLIVLFIVTSISGIYVYPQATYEQESFVSSQYTQFGEYKTFAKVTEPNPLYSVGYILENSPAYFYTISPDANIQFLYGIIPSNSSKIETDVITRVIITAKNNPSFWSKEYSIKNNGISILHDFRLN